MHRNILSHFLVGWVVGMFCLMSAFVLTFAQGSTGRKLPAKTKTVTTTKKKIPKTRPRPKIVKATPKPVSPIDALYNAGRLGEVKKHGTLVDEFRAVANGDLKARIDNFFTGLNLHPDDKGVIVINGRDTDVLKRVAAVKQYILFRRFDASRVEYLRDGNVGRISGKLYRGIPSPSITTFYRLPPAKSKAGLTPPVQVGTKSATDFFNRAVDRKAKGDLDGAISDYTKAIELDPAYIKVFFNRGLAYQSRGDFQKAAVDYRKVLEIDPNYTAAKERLEEVLKKIERP